jgi:hypothetical protein
MPALEVNKPMKRWIHTFTVAMICLMGTACTEDIPEVECGWVLPEPSTQRVPSRSGFNLRMQVIGSFTAEQIPAVRFYSDVEAAGTTYPEGILLESGIAIDEATGCVNGCQAGARLETAITPGEHQLTARALTPRGNTACEATISVTANSPPVVNSVTLSPLAPTTGDDVDFVAEVSDENGDTFQISNSWSSEAKEDPLLGAFLTSLHTSAGEVWQLSVSADDGTDRGDELVTEFTIANTVPQAPIVSIEPNPGRINSNLACTHSDLSDLDPDDQTLATVWSWQKDGVDAGIAESTVAATETAAGDVWTCNVVVSDGADSSVPGEASTTILAQLAYDSNTSASSLPLIAGAESGQSLGEGGQSGSSGDINGDGFTDFVLTANTGLCQTVFPFECNGQAHAYLFLGADGASPPSLSEHSTDFQPSPGFRVQAPAAVGDLNGDGIDDLALPYRSATWNQASGTSGIYLVFGSTEGFGAVVNLEADAVKITATAESSGTLLGQTPCPVGDLDGDGFDDLAVSAPGHDGSRGTLFVIYGHPGAWLSGLSPGSLQPGFQIRGGPQNLAAGEFGDGLGQACAGPIDLNADGRADLVVSAPRGGAQSNGWVLAFFGDGNRWSDEVTSAMADIIISGEAIESSEETYLTTNFGRGLAALGDHDGDGIDDLAIAGQGPVRFEEIAAVGDDDDSAGDDDDSASTPAQIVELEAGTIWIASGGDAALTGNISSSALPYRIEGDGNIGFCGLPYAADVDGDGLGDLVCSDTRGDEIVGLSPPGTPGVRVFAGTTAVISANRSYAHADLVFLAAGNENRFGASVARIKDFDGDLYEELLIGSPGLDSPLANAGGVYFVDLNP